MISQPSGSSNHHDNNEAEPLIQYRNATNFKTIQRNDPSVTEIVETSVYSVIYHYDEVSSKWAKQKQEGSLFIVKRDKAPEHALFMLNRQTVKNVTIPLIPGEMKVSIVDEAMLQVARRKQKPHIGIWFSEGQNAVSRFKNGILRICGEPSIVGNKGTPNPAPVTISSTPLQTSVPVDDGFSRLFAGLIKPNTSPPTIPPIPQATQTITTTTTNTTTTTHNTIDLTPPANRDTSAPQGLLYDHREISSHPLPPTFNISPLESVHPPGQTVDDLLMSILGLGPPENTSQSTSPSIQRLDTLNQPNQLYPHSPTASSNHASPAVHPPTIRSKVGEATFAQATRSTPPPPPPPIQEPPIHLIDGPSYLHHPSHPHLLHQSQMVQGQTGLPADLHDPNTRAATRETVLDNLVGRPPLVNGPDSNIDNHRRDPKVDFVNHLLRLVHTDPGFVNELWAGYLARMDSMRGRPG